MKKQTMIIRARRQENGKYTMVADNGDLPQDGLEHPSAASVYADCDLMYRGDTWEGEKVHSGYRITIN